MSLNPHQSGNAAVTSSDAPVREKALRDKAFGVRIPSSAIAAITLHLHQQQLINHGN